MEPPPPPVTSPAQTPPTTTTTTTTTTNNNSTTTYPDSIDSSPRSRATDFDEPFPPSTKLRLMCSYGGHIVPRPHDKTLCYVGGDTRMVVVDRSSCFSDLTSRLSKTLLNGRSFTLKYQLPNEDLDSLITVSSEEDLENMIDEYDRLITNSNPGKPLRIRLFLFPSKPEGATSIGSILDGSNRSEDWFLNALNGAAALQRGFSDPSSVNCLLGLEENGTISSNFGNSESSINISNSNSKEMEIMVGHGENKLGKLGNQNQSNPDIHSVPDSPIVETTSSFGSTSSSPSLANLPPIRVHVEDGSGGGGGGVRVMDQRIGGIEEQFAQMALSSQKQVDDLGFVVISSPPTMAAPAAVVAGVPAPAAMVGGGGEFVNRVFSDDERSDHGVPVGYRKQPPLQQQQMGQPVMTSQGQQKQMGGELPSPDSVSSDSSLSNSISRQKPVSYQDAGGQLSSGSNRFLPNMVDPNTRIQMQQVSEAGFPLPPQYEQHQLQLLQQQQHQQQQQQLLQQQEQQQLLQQQEQQQQQLLQQQGQQHQQLLEQQEQQHQQHQQLQAQTQQPTQQYIPAGAHFVHHHPAGTMQMPAYYPVYPPHQPHHQTPQFPVYYLAAGQPQGYNLPVQQQPNLGDAANANPSTRPQTPPNPTIITTSSAYNPTRNAASPKPEMTPGVYKTTAPTGGPQLIQVPTSQHQPLSQSQHQQQQQFMGYSHIHHPSQSIAPNSVAAAGYAYELADPAHAQMYYSQPLAPALAAQYQGMTSGPAMVLADGSSQVPNDNLKQQIRSSQPL